MLPFNWAEKHKSFLAPIRSKERPRPFETGLVKHCPMGSPPSFFTFLRAIFFHPSRLSLASTIRPWVFEDVRNLWLLLVLKSFLIHPLLIESITGS